MDNFIHILHDRWLRFNLRKQEELFALRKNLEITLYGSFQPNSETKFLLRLKTYLIQKGFANTKLVIDFPNPNNLNILEMSKECLEFSHVNFLIFTRKGKRHGVIRELAFVADSPAMKHKMPDCMVFDQILEERGSIPPLSRIDIKNSGIIKREFKTEIGLCRMLSRYATWQLRRFKNQLFES